MGYVLADVSEWQSGTDPAAIHAAGFGIIARLGYGANYTDRIIGRILPVIRANGALANGFYGFERSVHSPEDQVAAWMRVLGQPRPNEYGILDWETDPANNSLPSVAHRNRCLQLLDEAFGRLTVLYSGDALLRQYGVDRQDRPVWDADYGATPRFRPLTFWQFTNGEITSPGGLSPVAFPGAGRCDASIFNGTEAQFAAAVGIAHPTPADFLEELVTQLSDPLTQGVGWDAAASYVSTLYKAVLGTDKPDADGFSFWTKAIASGQWAASSALDQFVATSKLPAAKKTALAKLTSAKRSALFAVHAPAPADVA